MKVIIFMLVLSISIGAARSQQPASQNNAALHYYQALLSAPPETSLNEQERKALESWTTTPLDSTAEALMAKFRRALSCLHRGAGLQNCEWGLAPGLWDDGFEDTMPYLMQTGRSIARASLLRARWALANGRESEGYEEIVTVIVFARHVGAINIVLTKMLEFVLEENAIEAAAMHLLSTKDQAILQRLVDRVAKLPKSQRISDTIRMGEKAKFVGAIRKRGLPAVEVYFEDLHRADQQKKLAIRDHLGLKEENMPKLCQAISKIFDEAADIATKPISECSKEESRFKERLASEMESTKPLILNVFPRLIMPAISKLRNSEAKIEAKRALFRAAAGVAMNGVEKLGDYKDPFGNGRFDYRKTENGFELRSKLRDNNNEPVRLIVGKRAKE